MVVGPKRAMSPSSVFGLLQNIYSPSCRWKDNSPLVHHRSVTKKEWISPLMSQRIKRGVPTRARRCVYKQEPRRGKGRTHTRYPLHLLSIIFRIWATRSNFGIRGSVAGATPVQHSPFFVLFSGSGYTRTIPFWTILFDWRSKHHHIYIYILNYYHRAKKEIETTNISLMKLT